MPETPQLRFKTTMFCESWYITVHTKFSVIAEYNGLIVKKKYTSYFSNTILGM